MKRDTKRVDVEFVLFANFQANANLLQGKNRGKTMYNFFLCFGFGMMIVFALCAVVAFFGCVIGSITGVQLLLIVVCSLAGFGLSCELWNDGLNATD